MSQWEAKGMGKCRLCGTTNKLEHLTEDACSNTEWCAKQRVVLTYLAQKWGSVLADLSTSGAAAFEVGEKRYMLVDIGRTGELVGETVEEVSDAA